MKLVEDYFKGDQNPEVMQKECTALMAMLEYVCDQAECLGIKNCVESIEMAREQLAVELSMINRIN